MATPPARTLGVLTFLAAFALAGGAPAQSMIKSPGAHPDYLFEAEPHLVVGMAPPAGSPGPGVGPGFRGTLELVDNGFVSSINNTVGLGFGIDWIALSQGTGWMWLPVVMQWNFWLSRSWSVFGEPGAGLALGGKGGLRPAFFAGGRFHFSDTLALTLRAGYPTISVGLSFVL